jgi:hypothetical protein
MEKMEKYDFEIALIFNLLPPKGHIDIQQYATGEQIRKKKLAVTNETWGAATLVACTPDAFYRYQFENNVSIIVQSSFNPAILEPNFNPDINQHQHCLAVMQHPKKLTTDPINLNQIKKVALTMSEEAMQHNIININLQYQFIIKHEKELLEKKLTNKISSIIKDDKLYNANYGLYFQENELDRIDIDIASGFCQSEEHTPLPNGKVLSNFSNIVGLRFQTLISRNLEKLSNDKKIEQKNDFIINIDDMFNKLKNKSEIIYNSILKE